MILVDTNVWIDGFDGTATPQTDFLRRALQGNDPLCICDLVLMELLQGVTEQEAKALLNKFRSFPCLPIARKNYVEAAGLYRSARSAGTIVRKPVDCLIAACALTHGVEILTTDADFAKIAAVSKLKLVKV